jgi:uncharacterized protein YdaU (DUF1376 family)
MSKKVDIWMPIYIGDYLSATSRLTTEQHGAYILLLMDYWKNGPPPDNDNILAQITRMSLDAWSRSRAILEGFFEVSDGLWKHSRVERELAESSARKTVAVARAKAGAAAKWSKTNKLSSSDALSITQALLDPMLKDASSPSPSPIKTKRLKPGVVFKPEGISEKVWQDYNLTRQKPLTETALDGIAKEAKKAGWTLEDALRECVVRGWRGFKADWVAGKGVVEKPVRWNSSVDGIVEKGKELGIVHKHGETIGQYEERIREAISGPATLARQ